MTTGSEPKYRAASIAPHQSMRVARRPMRLEAPQQIDSDADLKRYALHCMDLIEAGLRRGVGLTDQLKEARFGKAAVAFIVDVAAVRGAAADRLRFEDCATTRRPRRWALFS